MPAPTCELCSARAATVRCLNDEANLCTECDYSLHQANPLGHRHERVPLAPSPSSRRSSPAASLAPTTTGFNLSSLLADDLEEPLEWFVTQAKAKDAAEAAALAPAPVSREVPSAPPQAAPVLQAPADKSFFAEDKGFLLGDDFDHVFGGFLDEANSGLLLNLDGDGVVPSMGYFPDSASSPYRPQGAAAAAPLSSSSHSVDPFGAEPLKPVRQERPVYEQDSFQVPSFHRLSSQKEVPAWRRASPQGVVPAPPRGHAVPAYPEADASSELSTESYSQDEGPMYVPRQRESRTSRPKEKRKRRAVEKVVRYPSRKAYADIRPRIKGRFATKAEVDALRAQGAIP